jgi:hypothetical protein
MFCGSLVGNRDRAGLSFLEVKHSQRAEEVSVFGNILLVDPDGRLAGRIDNGDGRGRRAPQIVAVLHPNFVILGFREIRGPACRLFPLVRFLIVEIANPDVGRGVGRVLPLALENGIGFIENNSGKCLWVHSAELLTLSLTQV